MGTRVISFYDKFTCLADKCPNTCCRGWRISIDDDSVCKYRDEKGWLGLSLKATMSLGKDKEIRRFIGRCANETREGLCRLELMGRVDLMPQVCRVYPRKSVSNGDDLEVTFELSCPLAAKLFLENVSDIRMVSYHGKEVEPVWEQDRFDETFYTDILYIRDKVTDYIDSEENLPGIMNDLFYYFRSLHKHVMLKDIDIKEIPIVDIDRKKGSGEERYNFFSFALYDKIIMNDLDDNRRKRENPLRVFMREYDKIFGDMTASEADTYFDNRTKDMIAEHDFLRVKYKAYLSYFLLQSLYSSYESVTFYKEYLLGMVYLTALITTDLVDYELGRDLEDMDRQIRHLNACERRFRHNVSVRKRIIRRLDEEFIKKKEGYKF